MQNFMNGAHDYDLEEELDEIDVIWFYSLYIIKIILEWNS